MSGKSRIDLFLFSPNNVWVAGNLVLTSSTKNNCKTQINHIYSDWKPNIASSGFLIKHKMQESDYFSQI